MYQHFNNNPCGKNVGDCVIRAISCLLNISWEDAYMEICSEGLRMCDMPSSNPVWMSFLKRHGYHRLMADNYKVKEFVLDFPTQEYIISTGTHVVCVKNGTYYDAWDSGDEIVESVFRKEMR